MELIFLIFIWPFLILAMGLTFVTFADVSQLSSGVLLIPFLFLVMGVLFAVRQTTRSALQSNSDQLALLRSALIAFSIAALLPVFIRYFLDSANHSLPSILVSLIIGFAIVIWGMLMKGRPTLSISNVLGGAVILFYVYFQLWSLGDVPRIIATAFGLLVAVVISVIKLKDKLV